MSLRAQRCAIGCRCSRLARLGEPAAAWARLTVANISDSLSIGFALVGLSLAHAAVAADADAAISGRAQIRSTYLALDDSGKDVIQGGEASDYWMLGGAGSIDADWGGPHLQADFSGEATLDERSADDTYRQSYGGGLHLGWRDPEVGSLGAFGSAGNVEIHDVGSSDPESVAWSAGLEGQAFFERITLYLQAGYLDRESVSSGGDVDALQNAGFGRVVARYFCGENLKLESEASFARGKMDPDSDTIWLVSWGAEAEYRSSTLPISAFAGYSGARYEQHDDSDVLYEHRIQLGARVYWGQTSLKSNDRTGASLDLPRYLEWNGQIAGALE